MSDYIYIANLNNIFIGRHPSLSARKNVCVSIYHKYSKWCLNPVGVRIVVEEPPL